MLWDQYVFRRGADAHDMWEKMFSDRKKAGKSLRLLYITGKGFDIRAQKVLSEFIYCVKSSGCNIENANLLLAGFSNYELDEELINLTKENSDTLKTYFHEIGTSEEIVICNSQEGEEDISQNNALKTGTKSIIEKITNQTDVVLDVSSLPRIAYLSFMLAVLEKLIPNKNDVNALGSSGINFHVLVGEDSKLDSNIQSEDLSNDLVLIPGYTSALQMESIKHWPMVWFPILGENRVNQLQKIIGSIDLTNAEICPVLPSPSKNPRRGDALLIEYKQQLFDSTETPVTNILYAHEGNPFEAYRQLYTAMQRYQQSMSILGGCRLVVTPLASKLITLGAGLACFQMQPTKNHNANYRVAIPYAEPKRYSATKADLASTMPEISCLLLTGEAYAL